MIERLLIVVGASMIAAAAVAQVPPRLNDIQGAPPVTPLGWDHQWLAERNTSWDYVAREGRPLVVSLPAAASEYSNGLSDYMWRLFYDDGYTLGQLVWRDQRGRTQPIRDSIQQIRSQLAEVRSRPRKFGGFDPNRIVIVGWEDDAFPASLIALSSGPRESSPVCAAIFIDGMNFDTSSPESVTATRRFAENANAAELSPARNAGNAPPTLLLSSDSTSGRHADTLAAAIKAAGGIAVRGTFSRLDERDPRTYLGYSENPATSTVTDFLRTYCPAEATKTAKP